MASKNNKVLRDAINQRIYEKISSKMKYMMRDVLSTVEAEMKAGKGDLFKKGQSYAQIRKSVLDRGNELIDLLSECLERLELTPKNSIVELSKQVLEELKKEEENGRS